MQSNSFFLLLSSATLALLLASGCTSDRLYDYLAHSDTVTEGAGNATAANRAVHTVDPWPAYSQKTAIDVDGKRTLAAVRRYETDQLAKKDGNLEAPSTSSVAAK
jgi:hypothetical protein